MKNFALFLIVVISFVSCKKDASSEDEPPSFECAVYNGITLPQVGDSTNYNVDTTTFKSSLNGGKDVAWNFTGLKIQAAAKTHYIDIAGLKYSSHFPSAKYTSTINDELVYIGSTPTGLEVQGAVITVADTNFIAVYDKKYNQIDFPLNYLDEKSSAYSYDETKYNLQIVVDGDKSSADSLVLSRNGIVNMIVDGCGTLTMPNATYEVLRIYKEETVADTVVAHLFAGFGTKKVIIVEKETIYKTYEFVTDSLSAPVLIIELNNNKEAEVVRFQN